MAADDYAIRCLLDNNPRDLALKGIRAFHDAAFRAAGALRREPCRNG